MVQKDPPYYNNIAVSGDISSGKSTLAKNLAKALGWKYQSLGEFFRQWHQKNHISLENTEAVPEDLDRRVDVDFQSQMKKCKGMVFESHLAGWLAKNLPRTFKILITADFDERMRRAALRENSPVEQVKEESTKRAESLADKFKKLYGVENSFDEKYYDLVVDSTNKSKEEVLEIALKAFRFQKRVTS